MLVFKPLKFFYHFNYSKPHNLPLSFYVETQGIKTFVVLVYANAEDLIKLVENESIKTIELDQVMASKRYLH